MVPQCEDLFCTLYVSDCPTDKSHKVLNWECGGQDSTNVHGHVSSLALFLVGSVTSAVGDNILVL